MKPTIVLDNPRLRTEIAAAVRKALAMGDPKFSWTRLPGEYVAAIGWMDNRQVGIVSLVDRNSQRKRWMWTILHEEADEKGVAKTGWAASAIEAAIHIEARYEVIAKDSVESE